MERTWQNEAVYLYIFLKSNSTLTLKAFNGSIKILKFSELLQKLKTHDCLRQKQEVEYLQTRTQCHYIFLRSKTYAPTCQQYQGRQRHR